MAGRPSKRQLKYAEQLQEMFDNYNDISKAYTNRVFNILKEASNQLKLRITSLTENEWLKMNLSKINDDLQEILSNFRAKYDALMLESLRDSSQAGVNFVIEPLRDNLDVSLMIQEPNVFIPVSMEESIRSTWNMTRTLILEVTQEAASKINEKIAIGMLTNAPRTQIIDDIVSNLGGKKLGFPTLNSRGWAIYRTETSRMFSNASQLQMRKAREFIPQTKKQWHHGAMIGLGQKPRPGHVALDGMAIDFEDVFVNPVTGEPLSFPHDPVAPAGEVVNCGCAHSLVMPDDSYLRSDTLVNV